MHHIILSLLAHVTLMESGTAVFDVASIESEEQLLASFAIVVGKKASLVVELRLLHKWFVEVFSLLIINNRIIPWNLIHLVDLVDAIKRYHFPHVLIRLDLGGSCVGHGGSLHKLLQNAHLLRRLLLWELKAIVSW